MLKGKSGRACLSSSKFGSSLFFGKTPASDALTLLASIESGDKFLAGSQFHVHAYARTRGKVASRSFTVVFYGPEKFRRKNAQFRAKRRESEMAKTPSVRNGAQAGENRRKNSVLN
jgi:hypothetical protein